MMLPRLKLKFCWWIMKLIEFTNSEKERKKERKKERAEYHILNYILHSNNKHKHTI